MFDKEKWLKAWNDNYKGVSLQAKELEKFMKANYKKHNYIPWATMVRMLYEQDPTAEIELITSGEEGGMVHTSTGNNETMVKEEKVKDAVVLMAKTEETYARHNANMVVVSCTFMGKRFIEYYPIQDNSYNAPYYYDSNMVNKAIQRAKAKIISIATGLAFRLYEDGDLQFEDDKTTEQKTIVEKPKVPTKRELVDTTQTSSVTSLHNGSSVSAGEEDESIIAAAGLVKLLRTNETDVVNNILQSVNADMVKIYKFSIGLHETDEELIKKISQIKNLTTFARVIKMKLEKGVTK